MSRAAAEQVVALRPLIRVSHSKKNKVFVPSPNLEDASSNTTSLKKFNAFISHPEVENYEAGV